MMVCFYNVSGSSSVLIMSSAMRRNYSRVASRMLTNRVGEKIGLGGLARGL